MRLRTGDGRSVALDASRWAAPARGADLSLLSRAVPPVLDIGRGPGRLTAWCAMTGLPALGIDTAPEEVRLTRLSGARATTVGLLGCTCGGSLGLRLAIWCVPVTTLRARGRPFLQQRTASARGSRRSGPRWTTLQKDHLHGVLHPLLAAQDGPKPGLGRAPHTDGERFEAADVAYGDAREQLGVRRQHPASDGRVVALEPCPRPELSEASGRKGMLRTLASAARRGGGGGS